MSGYKNEEYLKDEIMGQSRHQFIYSYDDDNRKSFLQQLDDEYPIRINSNLPMSIYLNEFGLPKINNNIDLDCSKIDILSREYLFFSIAYAVMLKTKNNVNIDLLEPRITKLLNFINKYSINCGHKEIKDFDELIKILLESKEFYMLYYIDYIKTGKEDKSINDITMPFLQLDWFISNYKQFLNNDSYFSIFIDKCSNIDLHSIRVVNFLVGARINKDISMKVVVEPGKWDSYVDINGQYIEYIHDYGIVDLDDSRCEYVKKLKRT